MTTTTKLDDDSFETADETAMTSAAVQTRAEMAHSWAASRAAEGVLPWTVRQHFGEDMPKLIAELATVTEQRDGHYAQFFDTQRELAAALTEVEQLRRELATMREVARGNKRHVATLSVLLERVEKLTVSGDGDDLDPDVAVTVGEIRRAVREPIPGEAGAR